MRSLSTAPTTTNSAISFSAASRAHGRPAPFMNACTMRPSAHKLNAAIAEPSATPSTPPRPSKNGETNVIAAPVKAIAHSAARRPWSSAVRGIIVVLLPGFTLAPPGVFGFAVRLAHRSIDGTPRGCKSVSETNPSQHAPGVELLVQPLAAKQTHGDAERDLHPQRPVVPKGFPVLLQGRLFGGDFLGHLRNAPAVARAGSSTLHAMVQPG